MSPLLYSRRNGDQVGLLSVATTGAQGACVQWSYHVRKILFLSGSPELRLLHYFKLFFKDSPRALVAKRVAWVSHLWLNPPLKTDSLCTLTSVEVFANLHPLYRCFSDESCLTAVLIYSCRDKYLEDSLVLCQVSKIIVLCAPYHEVLVKLIVTSMCFLLWSSP